MAALPRLARERQLALDRSTVPSSSYVALDVYETYAATRGDAVPLPRNVLNGPGDRRFAFTADGRLIMATGRNVPAVLASGT